MSIESDIEKLIDYIEKDGYRFQKILSEDYGKTIKVLAQKNGKLVSIPMVEQFYDTDEDGNRTVHHGEIDIRKTPMWEEVCAN